jgi:hypothetical protein
VRFVTPVALQIQIPHAHLLIDYFYQTSTTCVAVLANTQCLLGAISLAGWCLVA